MRTYKTEAIIIKRKNFGEADKIITAFTEKEGKVTIKAKGVRKITSRRSSHIELLNLSLLTLYKGKAWPLLVEAQTLQNFSLIKDDLKKIALSYYVLELVDKLCPEGQENYRIFNLLKDTLLKLSEEKEFRALISEFEVELLWILGYYPKKVAENFDTISFIEGIIERKLKTRNIAKKLRI